jgi:hypothetical protein
VIQYTFIRQTSEARGPFAITHLLQLLVDILVRHLFVSHAQLASNSSRDHVQLLVRLEVAAERGEAGWRGGRDARWELQRDGGVEVDGFGCALSARTRGGEVVTSVVHVEE